MFNRPFTSVLGLFACSVLFISVNVEAYEDGLRYECIHDKIAPEIKKAPPKEQEPVKREIPDDFETPSAPIRIHVHPDESLLNNDDLSHLYHNTSSVLWQAIDTYIGGLLVRPSQYNITISPTCETFQTGNYRGYCMNGTLELTCFFEYPEEWVSSQYVCESNEGPCYFEGEDGPGLNVDYILLVGAENSPFCGSNVLAFAAACNVEYEFYRPINGFFNLCPSNIAPIAKIDTLLYNIILHEITHAMAFSSNFFPFYGDVNPSVKRTFGDSDIFALSTQSITEYVQEHFDCPEVDYAPLENAGGAGTAGSHWEARMFNHELMTGFISYDYMTMSNFTWHYFNDSQWYDVNYSFTNSIDQYDFTWGKDKGCGIITGDCDDPDVYEYRCPKLNKESCAAERIGMGACYSLANFDYCQVVASAQNGGCLFEENYVNDTDDLFYQNQKYGEHSRCFEVWDIDSCDYSPGCYGTQVYRYLPTNEYAYTIVGHEDYASEPQWCYEGRHAEIDPDYVLCPPVSEILLHTSQSDILDVDDEVPSPLCDETCLTCSEPHNSFACLSCYKDANLEGTICNGTNMIYDPTDACATEPPPTEPIPTTEPPNTGCTAYYTECCIRTADEDCKTPGNCYCNYGCHELKDCCDDIDETCPEFPVEITSTKASTTTEAVVTTTEVVPTATEQVIETSSEVIEVTTTEKVIVTTEVVQSTTEQIIEPTTAQVIEVTTTEKVVETTEVVPTTTVQVIEPTTTQVIEVTTSEKVVETTEVVPTTTEQVIETSSEVIEVTTTEKVIVTTEVVQSTTEQIIEPTTAQVIEVTTTEKVVETTEVVPTTTEQVIEPTTTQVIEVTTSEKVVETTEVVPTTTEQVIEPTTTQIIEVTTSEKVIETTEVVPSTTEQVIESTSSVLVETTAITSSTTPTPSATPTPCQDNEARINNDNVVEWCLNGTWGSVCYDSSWDYKNAIVLCSQLDRPSSGAYVSWNEVSDDHVSHVSGVDCTGQERSLSECQYQYIDNNGQCDSGEVAKAYCVEGLSDCSVCSKSVDCGLEGITTGTSTGVSGSILSCTVQFSSVDLSTSNSDEFEEIKFLTSLSSSLVQQLGVVNREDTRATQDHCSVIDQFPQHGDPIVTLQAMGIETVKIQYQDSADDSTSTSVMDFSHLDLRNIISSNDFSNVFPDESIGCSFQHLLYWLTKVPTLAPAYCRVEEDDRSTLVDSMIHCNSPFQSCSEAAESDGFESGDRYPIITEDDNVEIKECS